MPKVKTTTLQAGPKGVIPAGSVIERSKEECLALIEAGYAVAVEDAPPEREDPTETAEAPEGEKAATRTGRPRRE